MWAGAVAQQSIIAASIGIPTELSRAQEALAIARQLDDPALIAQTLIACGMLCFYNAEMAQQYFAEAIDLVRAAGDQWSLSQIFSHLSTVGVMAGEPIAARAAAEEGRDLADALGDSFFSRTCRSWLTVALTMQGDLAQAGRVARAVAEEADAAGDHTMSMFGHVTHSTVLAFQGQAAAAHAAAQSALAAAEAMGAVSRRLGVLHVRPRRPRRRGRGGGQAGSRRGLAAHRSQCAKCSPGAPARWPRRHWHVVISRPPADGPTRTSRWYRAGGITNALTARAFVAIAQGEPGAGRARRP